MNKLLRRHITSKLFFLSGVSMIDLLGYLNILYFMSIPFVMNLLLDYNNYVYFLVNFVSEMQIYNCRFFA